MLHECSAYSNKCRASFFKKLEELLRDRYANFDLVSSIEKTLGSELWEQNLLRSLL